MANLTRVRYPLVVSVALSLAGCGASPSDGTGTGTGGQAGSNSAGRGGAGARGGAGGVDNSGGSGGSGGGVGGAGSGAGGSGGTGGTAPSDGPTAETTPSDSTNNTDTPTAPPPPPDGSFRHPGVLVNRAQLDFIRDKVKAGAQPWLAAFEDSKSRALLTHTPQPRAVVECGPYSMPNLGCAEEINDAVAAWAHALHWHITGDEAHARKAVEIMNAWGRTFKSHANSNGPLQAGWAGAVWPRAAELMRATYPAWPAADIDVFKTMLRTAYLAAVINGSGANGNWELSFMDAAVAIAVFLDDRASFDKALGIWRRRLPAYIYLTSDGARPVNPPRGSFNWYGQTTFVDGLSQETCRDLLHTQLGMSAAINVAETAYQQGVDLYKEQSERIRAGMEFHADYLLGKPAPTWLCGGTLGELRVLPMWEIAFNHYKNRLGIDMPLSARFITEKVRLRGGVYKHMAFETLTHAETAWVGLR
jgi:hypothetical protein